MMMTIREIVSYIKARENEGANDNTIDSELYSNGVTEEQLDEANDIYCDEYSLVD